MGKVLTGFSKGKERTIPDAVVTGGRGGNFYNVLEVIDYCYLIEKISDFPLVYRTFENH